MISSIAITNIRGIAAGELKDLTPLTVLVGPNGCGKSTVLEAAYMASAPMPATAIQDVVDRRSQLPVGRARWLLRSGAVKGSVVVAAPGPAPVHRRELTVERPSLVGDITWQVEGKIDASVSARFDGVLRLSGGSSSSGSEKVWPGAPAIALFQPSDPANVVELHSHAEETGRGAETRAYLAEVIPGLADIRILVDQATPVVHVVLNGYTVPLALEGDGIQSLLRLVLRLQGLAGGVALVEEPEAREHPRALMQTARALWAAVRRGTQIIMTTHSLEMIDYVLSERGEEDDVNQLSVYGLNLCNGVMKSFRLVGAEIAEERTTLGNDLR